MPEQVADVVSGLLPPDACSNQCMATMSEEEAALVFFSPQSWGRFAMILASTQLPGFTRLWLHGRGLRSVDGMAAG